MVNIFSILNRSTVLHCYFDFNKVEDCVHTITVQLCSMYIISIVKTEKFCFSLKRRDGNSHFYRNFQYTTKSKGSLKHKLS